MLYTCVYICLEHVFFIFVQIMIYLRWLYSIKKLMTETSEYLANIHTWPHLLDWLAMVFINQPNTEQIQQGIFIICGFVLPLHTLETAKFSWIFPDILFLDNCSEYFLICAKNILRFSLRVSQSNLRVQQSSQIGGTYLTLDC